MVIHITERIKALYMLHTLSANNYTLMPTVSIYTTPTCVYCKMTKEFFRKHNVSYEEKNVASDEDARRHMIEKSGQMGVPVTDIGGTIVIGFDEARLSQLLGI